MQTEYIKINTPVAPENPPEDQPENENDDEDEKNAPGGENRRLQDPEPSETAIEEENVEE